jgi:hypothetical protein
VSDRAIPNIAVGTTPITDASEPPRLRFMGITVSSEVHALCSTRQGCLISWLVGGDPSRIETNNAYFGLGAAHRGIVLVRFGWLGSRRISVYGIWPDFPADS